MLTKPKKPMHISERSKQFSPYETIIALDEAMRIAEQEAKPIKGLPEREPYVFPLDPDIYKVKPGEPVFVRYFKDDVEVIDEGTLISVDFEKRIVKTSRCTFCLDDLIQIDSLLDELNESEGNTQNDKQRKEAE